MCSVSLSGSNALPHSHTNTGLTSLFPMDTQVPGNLIRMSRALVIEAPPGIKAKLMHTLHVMTPERMDRLPAERPRLYFLLAWVHALIQERLRYVPYGWYACVSLGHKCASAYDWAESPLMTL